MLIDVILLVGFGVCAYYLNSLMVDRVNHCNMHFNKATGKWEPYEGKDAFDAIFEDGHRCRPAYIFATGTILFDLLAVFHVAHVVLSFFGRDRQIKKRTSDSEAGVVEDRPQTIISSIKAPRSRNDPVEIIST